jgi:hypothetical protein
MRGKLISTPTPPKADLDVRPEPVFIVSMDIDEI